MSTFTPNAPAQGKSRFRIRHFAGGGSEIGLFANGKLEIAGVGTYKVTASETKPFLGEAFTILTIEGVPASVPQNTVVKLYDDDDRYLADDPLYPSVLALQSPPLLLFPMWAPS